MAVDPGIDLVGTKEAAAFFGVRTQNFRRDWVTRPGFPTPIGVLRAWNRPRYEDVMNAQIQDVIAKRGAGDLSKLLRSGDTWEVHA